MNERSFYASSVSVYLIEFAKVVIMRLRDIASFWIVSLIPSIFSGKLSGKFYQVNTISVTIILTGVTYLELEAFRFFIFRLHITCA